MTLAHDLVINTEETLASLDDGDWDTVMAFCIASLLAKRPNDLVRILVDRAMRRSDGGDPVRHFQLIMRDLDLQVGPRL